MDPLSSTHGAQSTSPSPYTAPEVPLVAPAPPVSLPPTEVPVDQSLHTPGNAAPLVTFQHDAPSEILVPAADPAVVPPTELTPETVPVSEGRTESFAIPQEITHHESMPPELPHQSLDEQKEPMAPQSAIEPVSLHVAEVAASVSVVPEPEEEVEKIVPPLTMRAIQDEKNVPLLSVQAEQWLGSGQEA